MSLNWEEFVHWAQATEIEFDRLLAPDRIAQRAGAQELLAAGIAKATVESLYPPQPLAHLPAVQRLLEDERFLKDSQHIVFTLKLGTWLSLLPEPYGSAYARTTATRYGAAGASIYYLDGAASSRVLAVPDGNSLAAEELVGLPFAMRLCQQHDAFSKEAWHRSDRLKFEADAGAVRLKLAELIEIIRVSDSLRAPAARG